MKVGIIGGSGLDDPQLLTNFSDLDYETKYGEPSSKITHGSISGVEVCILARHGKKHEIPPSKVNYQANIEILSQLGCDIMSKDVQFFNMCNHIIDNKYYDLYACPRCYGKSYYIDICFDNAGEAVLAQGDIKLQQEILKIIRIGEKADGRQIFTTFVAWSPLGPCTISNCTLSPSLRLLKPSPSIAE